MGQIEPLDTIAGTVRAETVVTRSRFLTTLAPVRDRAAAQALLAAARREHHDARHHCSGMVLGLAGERERSSDDGEPAGTAGAPILAVLRGASLTDVLAIVTRYFGGTLLGAGGLARAYGDATAAAVAKATRLPRRIVVVHELTAGHEDAGRLEHRVRTWAEAEGAVVGPGRYGPQGASHEVVVPLDRVAAFRALLAGGGIAHHLRELGQEVRPVVP